MRSTAEPTRSYPASPTSSLADPEHSTRIAIPAETGDHSLTHLNQATLGRDLSTAGDMAAVLDWRLPEPAPTRVPPPCLGYPGSSGDQR